MPSSACYSALLPLPPSPTRRSSDLDAMTSQQADELHRSREQVRLSLHVVAVHARTEALQDGRLGPAREILREIQLASVPDTDVQEGVTYEVDGGALEGMGESRGSDQQKRARPPEPGVAP